MLVIRPVIPEFCQHVFFARGFDGLICRSDFCCRFASEVSFMAVVGVVLSDVGRFCNGLVVFALGVNASDDWYVDDGWVHVFFSGSDGRRAGRRAYVRPVSGLGGDGDDSDGRRPFLTD